MRDIVGVYASAVDGLSHYLEHVDGYIKDWYRVYCIKVNWPVLVVNIEKDISATCLWCVADVKRPR